MTFLGMGPFEIIIILLVAFIFLGPERMADAARTLGKWTSEFRRATAGVRAEMDDLITDESARPPQAQPPQPTPRATQTRPANADARQLDGTHPNGSIEPFGPTDADAPSADAVPDDAPVAFRRAPASPPQTPAAPAPKPPSDAAPTPDAESTPNDAAPNSARAEDNP